ncbi:hypothetical protein NZK35_13435 [Stieleria sp. ICT_E10.1]|nr:hypothetical protein [Stieleria sedimenti]MCS7467650.1 hypothetical protein [Stieleria sedimenti]
MSRSWRILTGDRDGFVASLRSNRDGTKGMMMTESDDDRIN